ncbi:tail fiber protein [Klebsiella phage KPN N141]|uniref:Tail fiber protein n=1 Tax=Klebsiella phage KPN N141 TaxID=2024239 RepID=A0A286MN82_9CAUD|nr:tail fiber protein [Klebsiella phage KPN N141]ASW27458.1 tail fiber protein [Klebsiella phage KPN N141]
MAADGTVTGTGTKWQSSLSLIRPGATIMFLSSPIQMAVVNKVVSDTEIKAITTKGAVVASSDYAILLSDSLTVDGLAQDVAETLRYYQSQETVISDAVEFFKTFDFESLQSLADSEAAGASAAAAAASEGAAKTSETNSKASEQAALTARQQAGSARDQTQDLYNQTVDLVAGVQAPDKLPTSPGSSRAWMKIANVKNAGQSNCFAQFIIGGGANFGSANLPIDIFSISGRGLPDTLTSNNIDANFTQCALIPSSNSTSRLKLGVVKNTDGSFDVYLLSPNGYFPVMWLNRLNVQSNNGLITGPIVDRTGYSWITTEPAGIVYNSPNDYLMANDSTIPRTNVANTFSQPQAISVPGGNATLTLNGCVVRANNSNAIVYSIPENGQGMYFRPNGDLNSAKQVVFDASNFTVTGLNASFSNAVTMSSTLRVNGSSNLRGGVDVTASQKLPLKETTATTGIGVNFIGDNATECSFGIENTAGGSAVFHNYTRGASNSATKNNQLLGGYGSRPWLGSYYTEHSNAALHFLGAGDASESNNGGWIRLLVTPQGKNIGWRSPVMRISDKGDTWLTPAGSMVSPDLDEVRSFETLNAAVPNFNAPTNQDGRGLKIVSSDGAPEINMIAPRGSNASSPAIRAMWCDGSLGNSDKYIGAAQAWSNFFFGTSGHDGEKFDSMRGAVNIQAPDGWGTTSTPTRILFETCAAGSTVRTSRWCVDHNGNFIPMGDGGYDIGWGSGRVNNIYAKNGAINTSDGRMKNDVRAMSDPETEAAKAIAKEIGFWTWKEQADMNDVREHCGLTVQRAIEIMESFGLEPFKYGFICYDKWDEQTVVSEYGPANEDGSENPIYKTIPAGDRYSFRIDELNMFIAKGFEARLSALEDKLWM